MDGEESKKKTNNRRPAESWTIRHSLPQKKRKTINILFMVKVQLSQIIVINTGSDRKWLDLIWLMLMTVTTNASFLKLDSPSLL